MSESEVIIGVQQELPLATVNGDPMHSLPQDLYIPPDALEVILESFEGPLDLLLYLIRKQNINIVDIPIARITRQYIQYINAMQELKLELAAEYLLMAAVLAEIKSKMLLPITAQQEEEEADPRAELARRLQEYEQYKLIAEELFELPQLDRDVYLPDVALNHNLPGLLPQADLSNLIMALKSLQQHEKEYSSHVVEKESFSIQLRMNDILYALKDSQQEYVVFTQLLLKSEGVAGKVICLMAILELAKQSQIEIVQSQSYGQIYLRSYE